MRRVEGRGRPEILKRPLVSQPVVPRRPRPPTYTAATVSPAHIHSLPPAARPTSGAGEAPSTEMFVAKIVACVGQVSCNGGHVPGQGGSSPQLAARRSRRSASRKDRRAAERAKCSAAVRCKEQTKTISLTCTHFGGFLLLIRPLPKRPRPPPLRPFPLLLWLPVAAGTKRERCSSGQGSTVDASQEASISHRARRLQQ